MDSDDISLLDRLRKKVHQMDAYNDIGICVSFVEAIRSLEKITWKYPKDSSGIHS